ncbi:molecular chaperone HtpG [Haematospirillum jordaniae]|uniref:molecular chaperone HtpG n=1 Tax=Haematospirillum jordaniae TaxID=1549855 RepID=UPI001432F851|nr:molecular chaperone HtpG [Haematospirillum jordaniae]NKD85761.1 molecular chaperone HtpG [Haematospirillum jordaniae]
MTEETMTFQAEVNNLLDIVVNSLYSQRDIFLRELISNASDACDKLRYEALTKPELIAENSPLTVRLQTDRDAGTLVITDNGIGMSRDELITNLGTIARSGTSEFVKLLSGDARKDITQIGKFGVGFYSAFMVADKVEVVSCRAGSEQGWKWSSNGLGSFTVTEAPDATRGTVITLHLKEDSKGFLEGWTLRKVVKSYSEHIGLPVILVGGNDGKSDDETLNTASALWTLNRNDITEDQYKDFYQHVAHAFDTPWMTTHYRAEGTLEYTALLFVPSEKPLDLFEPSRRQHVKLYANRVLISDSCEELLPAWLRFVRGVVDSADLPLNVSREMLQNNPMVSKIRTGLVKRLLADLSKKANDTDSWLVFWKTFGPVLKEGLYEDFERRNDILELARFHSTASDAPVSLTQYLERMKDGQEAIYFITGDSTEALCKSPQLEGYLARGIEVLLLSDPIDEFWTGMVPSFRDKPFRSVSSGAADLDAIACEDNKPDKEKDVPPTDQMDRLVAVLKGTLGDRVKDVRPSSRLTTSVCCLVSDEGQMSIHLERLMRQHRGEKTDGAAARVLEINPGHALIRSLAARANAETTSPALEDAAFLLLDQARIVEGELPIDPAAFAGRMARLMEQGLG